jgi:hypothetical protein
MRQLFARTPGSVRKAPARFRPQLESLESRSVPSTLVVTNNFDTGVSGDGSLRGELAAAASGDTIAFAGKLKGQTITLTQGELSLSQSLTIAGPVANPVTISGNQASRVFDITSSSAIVTLSGLTITQGSDRFDFGGGIYNAGTLTVSQCTLSGNSAGGGDGGGIYNTGTLTVSQSSLSGNFAFSRGGGIFNASSGTVTVSQSSLSGNSVGGGFRGFAAFGGGIYNAGTVTVSQSSLSGNFASQGGGIFNAFGATLNVLNHSSITGNTPDDVGNAGHLNQDKSSTIGVLD